MDQKVAESQLAEALFIAMTGGKPDIHIPSDTAIPCIDGEVLSRSYVSTIGSVAVNNVYSVSNRGIMPEVARLVGTGGY